MITAGCEGVRDAYLSGFLSSKDLFGFAFSKSVNEHRSQCHTSLDFRSIDGLQHQPNFFITTDEEHPKVIFIGKLRFKPSDLSVVKSDLEEIVRWSEKFEIEVQLDPNQNTADLVALSPDVSLGYFVVTELDDSDIESVIKNSIPHSKQAIFQFAIGSPTASSKSQDTSSLFLCRKLGH